MAMRRPPSTWSTRDIPNLHNKTVVVTGANSGLGFESARALARKGAEVILACRSVARGAEAQRTILRELPTAQLHVRFLDLQDLASIADFAASVASEFGRLDVLLNNAGVMNTPYGRTRDGFETQMGTNHLGHFALTGRLLPLLLRTPGSRVVTVSSAGHQAATLELDNLLFEGGRGYSPFKAYARSKLANLLFAYELQRRFEAAQIPSLSVAAHPGACQTNLGRHMAGALPLRILRPVLERVVPTAETSVLSQLRAAVDPGVRGGDYYGPEGWLGMRGAPTRVNSSRASRSLSDAKALWQTSERLTGLHYVFVPNSR